MFLYKGTGKIVTNCEPLQRDLTSFGPICVAAIFVIFLALVIIASAITQYSTEQEMAQCLQYTDKDFVQPPKRIQPKNILEAYLYCFSIQYIWKYFVSRRPSDKSQFNFLDGIRVGSMSWVI